MKRKKVTSRHLIDALAAGEADLHALASQQGMSLIDMARWVERPKPTELLRLLEGLLNRRTALLLAAARADAAESLRTMATADAPKETARKACVDLLKLQRDRDPVGVTPDGGLDGEMHVDPYAAIRRAVAELGEDEVPESHDGAPLASDGLNQRRVE